MQECEGHITTDECKAALKMMKINSSPGSDGLTTSWYIVFWNKVQKLLISCYNESLIKNQLSNSQRRGILTLLHKGKALSRDDLGNWRPISFTNTDYTILAKSLANRLKLVVNQTLRPKGLEAFR